MNVCAFEHIYTYNVIWLCECNVYCSVVQTLCLFFQISLEASMQGHMDDLKRLKCAGFMSEFGIGSISSLLFEVLDITDKLLQSWTGWDYKPYYGITVGNTTSELSCLPVGFVTRTDFSLLSMSALPVFIVVALMDISSHPG